MSKTEKKDVSSLKREDVPYTSHFCEENVYKLIELLYDQYDIDEKSKDGTQIYAVVISNSTKRTLVWMQRLNENDLEEPVVWDYHVIVLITSSDRNKCFVFDYDSVLPYPCSSSEYILKAFRPQLALRSEYMQLFRVIPGKEYLEKFSSDRSHMEKSSMPQPAWPLICGSSARSAMELPSLWEMRNEDIDNSSRDSSTTTGRVIGVRQLLQLARSGSF